MDAYVLELVAKLNLSGLTSLSVEVAEALSQHQGELNLSSLTSLSLEAAQALAKHPHKGLGADVKERLPSEVVSILAPSKEDAAPLH